MSLAGAHALITGGGTGIGAAIARTLSGAGARVTLVGRRAEVLEDVAASLNCHRREGGGPSTQASGVMGPRLRGDDSKEGGDRIATHVAADVTDPAQVADAFAQARAVHGPVTILVNNAGASGSAPFSRTGFDQWRETMAVNLDALFHCIQAALPDLRAAAAGRIVTVASTAGLKGYAYVAPYVAAKHGAIGLTRALALELAGTAVTVNAVCPGFTDTDLVAASVAAITAKTGRDAATARAELAAFNPQKRLIDPQEVADAVLWLCQPGSASITGQAIAVAGGEVM